MAQNPHHYPWCHAPSPMQRCSARVPINAGEVSPATMGGEITGGQLRDDACGR